MSSSYKKCVMDVIDRFLNEDIKRIGDITSDSLFTDETGEAVIVANEDCVIAGLEEAKHIFERVDAVVALGVNDGAHVKKGEVVLTIHGFVRSILKVERLSLNFIGRMSGIATQTNKLVNICKKVNPHVKVAATRKTTPGFRKFEKKAILLGGGEPHRYGLFDMVMIKDNHIKCVGSIEKAIQRVKKKITNKLIEVEVETIQDAIKAASMDVDIIMLDNMSPAEGAKIAKKIRAINKDILIEASGGITLDNIVDYASFADRISLGCLTHSVKSIDFSLEIKKLR